MSGLPANWVRARLGEHASFEMGQAPPGSASNFDGRGAIFVKAGEFGKERPIVREWTTDPKKFASNGDVLMCVVGATSGKLNLGIDCAIGRSVAAIKPGPALHQKALYYQLLLQVAELRAKSSGSAQGVISREMLSNIPIVVPPLAEQKRIADKLDRLLAAVDTCRARLDAIPAILKRFRQSVLAAATSGELTEEWRTANGVPSSWHRAKVSELCEIQNGRAFPSDAYADAGVRLLRPGNLAQSGVVEWNERNTVHLPSSFVHEFPEFLLGSGELLMNLTAQSLKDEFLGRVCLKNDEAPALLNQRIARLIPKAEYDVRPWLFLFFRSPKFRAFVDSLDTGTLIRHMHSKQVRDYEVELPCIAERKEILSRVDRLFAAADMVAAEIDAARARINKLTQGLLAKAFRGALLSEDANNPSTARIGDKTLRTRAASSEIQG